MGALEYMCSAHPTDKQFQWQSEFHSTSDFVRQNRGTTYGRPQVLKPIAWPDALRPGSAKYLLETPQLRCSLSQWVLSSNPGQRDLQEQMPRRAAGTSGSWL